MYPCGVGSNAAIGLAFASAKSIRLDTAGFRCRFDGDLVSFFEFRFYEARFKLGSGAVETNEVWNRG